MLVCLNVIGKPIRQIKQDSLRELVSLESGLWQFVCENELTRCYNWDEWKYTETFPWDYRDYPADEHQYRLLESALIPEEELGKFLVDNIVIEWNQTLSPETK